MKIYTKQYKFDKGYDYKTILYPEIIKDHINDSNHILLRYAIVETNKAITIIEASIIELELQHRYNRFERLDHSLPECTSKNSNDFAVVNIVPTGVRAEIGGYIADATPVTNVMAEIADIVITHPNVVNGSFLNYMRDNVLYVEGHHLDNFLNGIVALEKTSKLNRIGVIIDRGAINTDPESFNEVINTIEALRVIAGIDVVGYKITDEPISGHAIKMPSGAFSGEIKNPQTLLKAVKELDEFSVTAVTIATHIDIDNMEDDLDKYFKGNLANPFGGTEALISHLVSYTFGIPCAHAPILSKKEKDYYNKVGIVDPRASSEVVSPGYLGCILKGLSRAPQITNKGITINNVRAIVIPYSCAGGIPAFASQLYNIPLICVKENKTVMNVTPEMMQFKNVFIVENYLEAIGIIAALKAGITVESLRRPFKAIQELK